MCVRYCINSCMSWDIWDGIDQSSWFDSKKGRNIFLYLKRQNRLWGPPSLHHSIYKAGSFSGIKAAGVFS